MTPSSQEKMLEPGTSNTAVTVNNNTINKDTVFTLKRWNLVAMWSWDVECEVCAICRTPLMGKGDENCSLFFFFFISPVTFAFVFRLLLKVSNRQQTRRLRG